jgi:predicted short-subunit dehydrogenase-like oxidoreductase (DUF2520 family)
MGQYLIIGSGRTARHFAFYFQQLGLQFDLWNRHESPQELQSRLQKSTHALLLISDSAIEGFYKENLKNFEGPVVHFSGALEIPEIESAHPLMTFSQDLYSFEDYKQIPFITTSKKAFQELLPGLSNPHFQIQPEQKPLYHALCVLSGNFTTLLWQKMNSGLKDLGLPEGVSIPYMRQTFKNLEKNASQALTGPLARKDLKTVLANDRALQGDSAQDIYRSFVRTYFPEASQQLEGAK